MSACAGTLAEFLLLVGGDANRLAKGRRPAGIGYPEDWIFRDRGIGMAAQIGEIDKTHRCNVVCLNPFEYWAEISASTALRFQLNGF